MNTVKDVLSTSTMIALIMLAIVGAFHSTMDRPSGHGVLVSAGDR
jgi:hypothetical protein